MTDLLIRDIPVEIKRKIAANAKSSGRSLSDEAKRLILAGLRHEPVQVREKKNPAEALRAIFRGEDEADDEFARIMDEIEAERKRDFGRPPPDFE
jgi:plasmid stability protein